jgi:hypothetical protein
MTMILGGTNPAVTFPDSTVQNTAYTSSTVIGYSQLPTGSVLQVVNAIYATQTSTSTSTYVDTGLTATITPKFATSKILVMVSQNGVGKSGSDTSVNLKLQKNGSDLVIFARYAGATNTTTANFVGSASIEYLDSPATTSATTYKTQFASDSNTATAYTQFSGSASCVSTITLLEIAG